MVWPIIAIAAVSAAAQLYQSEKARGANAKRLKELEREFDALVPPGYDISPMDPPAYVQAKLKDPSFDGDLTPTMAAYVEEQSPEQIQMSGDAQTGRGARMEALRRMQSIGSANFDPNFSAALSESAVAAGRDARGRAGAVRDRFARRGALDSGMAMLSEIQENASANETQALAGQRAAAESYRNRLDAIRDSARMGADIEGDDLNMSSRNAGIVNDFNARTSKNRQTYANNRADVLNNSAASNQSRRDALAKYGYSNEREERDNVNRQNEARTKWRASERDRADNLTGRMYDDQVQKAGLKRGMVTDRNDLETGAARDRNSAIQGVGNAGMSYYQSTVDQDSRAAAENREDRRRRSQINGKWG